MEWANDSKQYHKYHTCNIMPKETKIAEFWDYPADLGSPRQNSRWP